MEPSAHLMLSLALSRRHAEIVLRICRGLPYAEIGTDLGISRHTVVAHVRRIHRRFSVNRRSCLVRAVMCELANSGIDLDFLRPNHSC